MKISAIIPTFNRCEHISNAIKSIQNQTYQVDEIIVIDDGSTDKTREYLKDENIRYIYQENSGVSIARNRGIQEAKNEWITFLDSDDIWEENKIEAHFKMHQNKPTLFASYTDEQWINNGKVIKIKTHQKKEEPSFLNSLRLCKIGASTFFCHKSIFSDIGYFDEALTVCEDYDLWLRILKEYEIKLIDEKLTIKYAGHENQLSFSTKLIDTYRIRALKKHLFSKYHREVLDELIYKTTLLLKGARKHNNIEIVSSYEKELAYFESLVKN